MAWLEMTPQEKEAEIQSIVDYLADRQARYPLEYDPEAVAQAREEVELIQACIERAYADIKRANERCVRLVRAQADDGFWPYGRLPGDKGRSLAGTGEFRYRPDKLHQAVMGPLPAMSDARVVLRSTLHELAELTNQKRLHGADRRTERAALRLAFAQFVGGEPKRDVYNLAHELIRRLELDPPSDETLRRWYKEEKAADDRWRHPAPE